MPSEVDEAYDKIRNFAEDIMWKYMQTQEPKRRYLLRYRREALYDVLCLMVKYGLIAKFDIINHDIFME